MSDIEKAVKKLKEASCKYTKFERYYRGDHDLAFATEKFTNAFGSLFREFAMNLCPAVVDAVRDKLVITEFGIEEGEESAADQAWKIWQANRMGIRSGEVHKEAAKNGDAYVIVWVDPEGRVTIYPQKAACVVVFYDEETPGKILWAAKYWKTSDKRYRLNLFYPDRIERYISKAKKATDRQPLKYVNTGGTDLPYDKNFYRRVNAADYESLPDAKNFEEFDKPILNPYGVVPVFHFANNGDVGSNGTSELLPAIPVQDALNKSVLDMMVAMEFQAYRQRWASGVEIEYDNDGKPIPPFRAGIEHLWLSENPDAKFGDFEATDLEQFLKVKESFRVDIACVTGTPLYYFMQTGANFPSGESLKKSETRFLNKVRDRQQSFGAIWEDVMAFALRIEHKVKDVRLFAEWKDPAPLSEKEELDNLILKKEIGVTDEQLMMEAGYGEADIQQMLEAKAAEREAMVRSFNRGEIHAEGGIDDEE